MIDPVPPPLRERYVMRAIDARRQEVRIVPELRRAVRFECLNLMEPTYRVDRDFDVIFCRNILIYFAKGTQNAVLKRLCNHLRKGGFLILGHSESLAGAELSTMRQMAPTVFRRAA
jgi:chemotaxis protein methyltransferase CheR